MRKTIFCSKKNLPEYKQQNSYKKSMGLHCLSDNPVISHARGFLNSVWRSRVGATHAYVISNLLGYLNFFHFIFSIYSKLHCALLYNTILQYATRDAHSQSSISRFVPFDVIKKKKKYHKNNHKTYSKLYLYNHHTFNFY